MGKPAARITDMHTCPMVTPGTPPVPHVGGPITGPGIPTVLIGGIPAAVLGDMCTCVGPPATIIMGSTGVMIGGKPAARMGDPTAHGGIISVGLPTVLIGEVKVIVSSSKLSVNVDTPQLDQFQEALSLVGSVLTVTGLAAAGIALLGGLAAAGTVLTVFGIMGAVVSGINMSSQLGETAYKYGKGDTVGAKESFRDAAKSSLGMIAVIPAGTPVQILQNVSSSGASIHDGYSILNKQDEK